MCKKGLPAVWTKEKIEEAFAGFVEKNRRLPVAREMKPQYGLPTRRTFERYMDTTAKSMLNFVTPRFSPQEMSAMFKPSWHIGTKYVSGLLSGLWRRKRTFLQNAGGYLNRMNTRLRTVCLCTLSSVG